jgi:hypothetical protein
VVPSVDSSGRTDCFVAISLENTPLNVFEFVFHEPLPDKLRVSYNSPFVTDSPYPSFGKTESLDLHSATARILDDIRYLFSVILDLPPDPVLDELDRVQDTARLILHTIEKMPDICPDAPTPLGTPVSAASLSAAPTSRQSTSLSPLPPLSSVPTTREPSSETSDTDFAATSARTIPQSHDPSHFILRKQPQAVPQYAPDFIYATVRQTALLYARAAATRSSLREVCPVQHFFLVWSTAFRVPLNDWHRRLGVFLWVIIAMLPTAAHTPFATLAKSLLHIGAVQVGLDHWDIAIEMLRNAVRVVGWLSGGGETRSTGYNVNTDKRTQAYDHG